MAEEYTKEQLWKLYEVLPEDLKKAIFSEETANSIYETCTRNNLAKEKIPEIARYTGYILMGLLPPDEFEKTLKEKVGLKNDLAKKVSQEISRFIFFPLRGTLEMIYKTEIKSVAKPKSQEKPSLETTPRGKPKKDVYREPVE